jgi:hypothetical protein
MPDDNQPRPLSPDEIELLKKYRDLSMPAARLAGLDDFAKWLFSSITVIGSLAAGFSTVAIKTFDTRSASVFFVAIFLTGISLFLAVCLRAIEPKKSNYQSLPDMLAKNDEALRRKQKLAAWSGGTFALAVLASGFAPLASVICRPAAPSLLLYSYGKEGLKASASFRNSPHTASQMKIIAQKVTDKSTTETVLSVQRMVSGDDGVAKLELSIPTTPPATTALKIDITCDEVKQSKQTIVIKLSADAPPSFEDQKTAPQKGCVI